MNKVRSLLPAFVAIFIYATNAGAQRPDLYLVTPERLTELQALVTVPGTPHYEAFEEMKLRVDGGDPFILYGSYTNYKRAFFAREASWMYLLTGTQAYADLAYQMLDDIYNSDSPPDDRTPTSGSGLNRAQISSSFAMAYNWAYDGWTQAQRDWVKDKIDQSLNSWPSHANIGSPWMSNWNGVLEGSRLMTLVAAGEWENRYPDYKYARRVITEHVNSFGTYGWNQEGNGYLGFSMENVLAGVLAMAQTGDPSGIELINNKRMHHLFMYASMFNASQNALNWGTGAGMFDNTGTTSLLMGLVPPADLPYYTWYMDHFRGMDNPAVAADKYDWKHGASSYFMIYYPDTVPAENPTGEFPGMLRDSLGGYILRDGWQDQSDTAVSLWSQTRHFEPSWNSADILHLNIAAHDTQWGIGPGAASDPSGDFYSTLLVDTDKPNPQSTGNLISHLSGTNGGYVVADGGNSFGSVGVSRITRHLLADFGGATDVLSILDITSATSTHTYGWNLYTHSLTLSSGTDNGLSWMMATNPFNGAWLKAWAVTPGAGVELGGNSMRFNYDADNIEIRVLCQIGTSADTPAVPVISGSGVEAVLTIDGRDFGYDAATQTLSSTGVTDLRDPVNVSIAASATVGLAPLTVDFAPGGGASGLTYAWDLGDGTTRADAAFTHTFTEDGTYKVMLVARDATGVVSRSVKVIQVGNRPPDIEWTIPKTTLLPGESMTLDASASTDPENDALTFEWIMGDGTTYTTPSVTHGWAEGTYTVNLKITDSAGNIDGESVVINVLDQVPVASATFDPVAGLFPLEVFFDASASWDPEGQSLSYEWDFDGNGSIDLTTTEETVSHIYTSAGEFNPEVFATDPGGNRDRGRPGTVQVFDPANVTPPVTPAPGTYGSGLNYGVYLHDLGDHVIPDFTLLNVKKTGRIGAFDMNASQPYSTQFALLFEGYIDVPETGVYTFRTDARGTLRIYVAGELLHFEGRLVDSVETGIYLQQGLHAIRLETSYSNAGPFGDAYAYLEVDWKRPGSGSFTTIPPSRLLSDYSVFYPTFDVSPDFKGTYVGHPGDVFHFEATMPSPDGQPLQYHWDFGDGTTANTRTVSKSFDLPANMLVKWYEVRLTITDSSGATGVAGQQIRISPYAYTLGRPMENRLKDGEFSLSDLDDIDQRWDRRTDTSRAYRDAVNKAVEAGTIVVANDELRPDVNMGHIADGVFNSRWIDERPQPAGAGDFETWVQFTFQKDGVLQPYNITEYSLSTNYMPWTWPSDPKEWDIYVSNVASPAQWDLTPGAANADWTLLHEERDPRMDYQFDKENKVNGLTGIRYSLPNTQAYPHYLFVLRNQGPNLGWYRIEVDEIELFDWMTLPQAGNSAPLASLSAPLVTAESPLVVDFDASATVDPDGDALYYEWDFGDGHTTLRTEDLSQVQHVYRDVGTYNASVTVIDGHGLTDSASLTVTVEPATPNSPPVVDLQVSATSVIAGTAITYDASGTTDPDGDALSFLWQFGNGQSSTEPVLDFAFTRDGVYNVLLKVTDARGLSALEAIEITSEHPNGGRPVISVNFASLSGGYITPAVGAGFVSVGNWNTFAHDDPDPVFLDSLGRPTSFSMDGGAYRVTNKLAVPANVFDGNAFMYKYVGSGDSRNEWNISLADIPYPLYDLYLYFSGAEEPDPNPTTSFTLNGETYWTKNSVPGWPGSFQRATAATELEAVDGTNYVVFENLSDFNPTIYVDGSNERHRVAGIQIVDKSGPGVPFIWNQPESAGVIEGDVVTFSVVGYGNPDPTYQWFRDGSPIAGATQATYGFQTNIGDDGSQYYVELTNENGTTPSAIASLTVVTEAEAQAPVFLSQSPDQSVDENTEVTLSVDVSGMPTPSLQWYRNGSLIEGATGSTYTFTAFLSMDGNVYTCRASNVVDTVTSSPINLAVSLADFAPVITSHPVDFTVRENRNAEFTVVANGRPSPGYQWRQDGVDIPGATDATYVHLAALADDGSLFDCVVSNSEGSATSNAATLSVTASGAPMVDGFLSVNFEDGDNTGDELQPLMQTGVVPLGYWNNVSTDRVGELIGGLFTSVDADSPAQLTFSGARRISNANPSASDADKLLDTSIGGVHSSSVTLTNLLAAYPNGFHLYVYGRAGESHRARAYSIDVPATGTYYSLGGTGAFDGEWTRAEALTAGTATAAEYVRWQAIPAVDSLTLTSNPFDDRASISGFQILPASYPFITTEPVDATVAATTDASFSIVAGGDGIAYQWRRDGIDIPGATASSYSFTTDLIDTGATFDCVVSNSLGSVVSETATLTVVDSLEAAAITLHPVSLTDVSFGDPVIFTGAATGSPAPALQWHRNGNPIDGETGTTLTLEATNKYAGDAFTLVATNSTGTATSDSATFSITLSPEHLDDKISINIETGNGDLVTGETGVVPLSNWNNINQWDQFDTIDTLMDSDGNRSPVTLRHSGGSRKNNTGKGTEADKLLFGGIGGVSEEWVEFSGLNAVYPNGFHLYVYSKNDTGTKRSHEIDAPGTWDVFHTIGGEGNFDGTWTRVTSTDSATPGDGEYVLWENIIGVDTLRVTSRAVSGGRSCISGVQIIPVRINTPPAVTITEPADGSTVTQGLTLSLTAQAVDDIQVDQVEFFVDGSSVGLGTFDAGLWTRDWTAASSGTFSITATATDDEAASATSAPVTLHVSATNVPPSVSLTAPVAGAFILNGDTVTLTAEASDDQGVSKVEFFANGVSLGTDTDGADGWSSDWVTTTAGAFDLTAEVTDIPGDSASSGPVSVTVEDLVLSPPVADYTVDVSEGGSPLLVTFDAGASSDSGGNNSGLALYHWDFDGDGVDDLSTADPVASFTFTQSGTYDVRLTVEDIDGQTHQVTYQIVVHPGIRVGYAAPSAASQFAGVLELSDGTILIGGSASNLSWVPGGTPLTAADNPEGALVDSNNRIAFLMRVSADLGDILHVWHLPAGAAGTIQRIRATNIPGEPTGVLYVSGPTDAGYFIGRLDGNFVDATPAGFEWVLPIATDTNHADPQPWDVSADGVLVYQNGSGGGPRIDFLDALGNEVVLPDLRATHWVDGSAVKGVGSDFPTATASTIQFITDLQSWTEAERTAIFPDGNGESKMGTWPFDIFITGKLDGSGPVRLVNGNDYGYTGYRYAGLPVIRSIVVDRRSGDFYLGFNSKSKFYDHAKDGGIGGEQPDFEPAVIAYDALGGLKWWSRLYHEWIDANGDGIIDSGNLPSAYDGETRVSPPDQYVDGLEIDYSKSEADGGMLVVNARAHGSGPENLWEGNSIAARPGAGSFHTRFTGTEGNIHVSWIGKLALADGTLQASTYLAGFWRKGEGNWPTVAYTDPNLDGWPSHNAGWPQLTTTKAVENTIRVDSSGRVYVIGQGPRMVTTRDAWQKIPRRLGQDDPILDEGVAPWHQFVRVFSSDLSTLNYSTALTGIWTYPDGDITQEPIDDSNTQLMGILPLEDGLLVAGYHKSEGNILLTKGNPVPVNDVPDWGTATPGGQTALFGRFFLTESHRFNGYDQNYRDHAFTGHALGTWGGHTDLDVDANNDGQTNRLDYAFRARTGDPADVAAKQPWLSVADVPGGPYLDYTFRQVTGGSGSADQAGGYVGGGFRYTAESSSSLDPGSWSAGGSLVEALEPVDNGDGTESVTLRTLQPVSPGLPERIFIRLRVEDAE